MRVLRLLSLFWQRVTPFCRRHKKILLTSATGLVVFVLAIQLAYPGGQALPGAKLNGETVQGKSYDELVERIKTGFQDAKVTLKAKGKSTTVPLSGLGASPRAEEQARGLLEYPLWQRLVPFSIVFKERHIQNIKVSLDDQQLETAAKAASEELSVPAESAKLTISESKLTTTPAKSGQKVTEDMVKQKVMGSDFRFGTTDISFTAESQAPKITDDHIAAIQAQAEEIIKRQIVIVAENGTEFTPGPEDITSWLTVAEGEDGKPRLTTDEEQVGAYIQNLNTTVGTPPGTVTAVVVDGEETSRTSASSGLAIAADELKNEVRAALFDASKPSRLSIRMVSVPPVVRYERSYTSSQKGLSAYVEYVTASENVRIAVSQVSGKGWSASGRADEQTVSASTYKLYVAAMLFKQIEDKKIEWGSKVLDTDADGCLERMIVVSDNACAEEFVRMFGGKTINAYLYSKGMSKMTTLITEDGIAQSTAADLAKMLRGIEDGSILSGSNRKKLLELMERQRYRSGVPAGSSGTVQDKVGFLWDYLNDAAIVRHPKGAYVVAVMTKGSSWGRIAEITRQIEHIMYP